MSKKMKPAKPLYPMFLETFRELGSWELSQFRQEEPSCFNGIVNVRRYRITIEEIQEPDSVIAERLQKMWDECDNHHHAEPLRREAQRIGFDLGGRSYGTKRKDF